MTQFGNDIPTHLMAIRDAMCGWYDEDKYDDECDEEVIRWLEQMPECHDLVFASRLTKFVAELKAHIENGHVDEGPDDKDGRSFIGEVSDMLAYLRQYPERACPPPTTSTVQ